MLLSLFFGAECLHVEDIITSLHGCGNSSVNAHKRKWKQTELSYRTLELRGRAKVSRMESNYTKYHHPLQCLEHRARLLQQVMAREPLVVSEDKLPIIL